jgi:hypothetical protein
LLEQSKFRLGRNWALARLTFGLAGLLSGSDIYLLFCIAVIIILKYAAKLERYFQKAGILPSAKRCQIEAKPCHLLKKWEIPPFL